MSELSEEQSLPDEAPAQVVIGRSMLFWLLSALFLGVIAFATFLSLRVFASDFLPRLISVPVLIATLGVVLLFVRRGPYKDYLPYIVLFVTLFGLQQVGILLNLGTVAAAAASALLAVPLFAAFIYYKQSRPLAFTTVSYIITAALIVLFIIAIPSALYISYRAIHVDQRQQFSQREYLKRHEQLHRPATLHQINAALKKADSYLSGLYNAKGLFPPNTLEEEDGTGDGLSRGEQNATLPILSEYYGFPIAVMPLDDRRWRLLGDTAVRVQNHTKGATSETFMVSFNLSRGDGTWADPDRYLDDQERILKLAIEIDWNWRPDKYLIRVRSIYRMPPHSPMLVRLGSVNLGVWTAKDIGRQRTYVVPAQARSIFASTRYTVRQVALSAARWLHYHRDERAAQMQRTVAAAGFTDSVDMYAPLWRAEADADQDMVTSREQFVDCYTQPDRTDEHQLYRSKVCRLPIDIYRWALVNDPLSQSAQALQVLQQSQDPDASYDDLDLRRRTPTEAAARLEQLFDSRLGRGLVRCLPLRCESSWYSSVRTYYFGALEAELGYRYDDPISRSYADYIARIALKMQAPTTKSGQVSAPYQRYLRPVQQGGFYTIWSKEWVGGAHSSILGTAQRLFTNTFDMPSEYDGVVPTNSEATLAAYAFLLRYRCLRWGEQCQRSEDALHFPTDRLKRITESRQSDPFGTGRMPSLYYHTPLSTGQEANAAACRRAQRVKEAEDENLSKSQIRYQRRGSPIGCHQLNE